MIVFVEQPLRMVGISGAVWSFSAKPLEIELWAGAIGVPPVSGDGWTAGPGASWRTPVTPLPAGYDHCWDLPANGKITATMPVRDFAGGQVRVSGRIWNRSTTTGYGFGWYTSWTVADGGQPLPGEGAQTLFVPAKAGTFSDFAAWTEFSWTIDVPDRADTLTLDLLGSDQNQRTYLLDVILDQVPEPGKTIEWGCLAAKDGHLDGLWSLPQMQGEILENVLYGGGLAPASPTWGPRPVTYHLAVTGINRPVVLNELKRFTGFLASGPLTVYHHQYGICQNGFLAAPPTIEWLDYISNTAKVTFTLTFLDPRIWSVLRHDSASLVEWVAQNWTRAAYEDVFTFWSGAIEPPQPGEGGLPPTQVPISNGSGAPVYPLIAWKAEAGAGDPGVVGVSLLDGETPAGACMWSMNATGDGALYVADMSTLKVFMLQNGVMNDTWATVISTSGSWELAPGQQAVIDLDTDQSPYMNVEGVASVVFQASM